MSEALKQERNNCVDILRGAAMLFVVLQHTMAGSTADSQDSFLFQVVWSLQMPLFFLISGYVTRYSKPIRSVHELARLIGKRTISYLLPWGMWSFVIRGIVFKQSQFLNLKWLLWHMDSGYWFLFSLWMIVLAFLFSQYAANKMGKGNAAKEFAMGIVVFVFEAAVFAGIGCLLGMAFLGLKLTVYYMPFYYLGYLYGRHQEKLLSIKRSQSWIEWIGAVCLAVWLYIISRVNLYYADETVTSIIVRVIASLAGCVAVCSFIGNNSVHTPLKKTEEWIGKNSMGIYTIHYMLLNILKLEEKPMISTFWGGAILTANFLLTVTISSIIVILLSQNKVLSFLLLGRIKK